MAIHIQFLRNYFFTALGAFADNHFFIRVLQLRLKQQVIIATFVQKSAKRL